MFKYPVQKFLYRVPFATRVFLVEWFDPRNLCTTLKFGTLPLIFDGSKLCHFMPTRSPRHRAFCFTCPNYNEANRELLDSLCGDGIARYVCYQGELAPSTSTPHLQGYLVLANPRTFDGTRELLGPRFHLEIARGSAEQNIEYCSKSESRDPDCGFEFVEHGDRRSVIGTGSGSGTRTDLAVIAKRLRDGETEAEIAEDHPASYIMYTRGIRSLAQQYIPRRSHKSIVYWYWGPTGTGKTRAASEESPDAYWKSAAHQWWDGYDGLADVIIDDYRASFCQFNELLRMLDRYPYQVQVKGSTVQFNAKRIFITSPKDPRETWSSRTEEDVAQLERRIEHVKFFGEISQAASPHVSSFNPSS